MTRVENDQRRRSCRFPSGKLMARVRAHDDGQQDGGPKALPKQQTAREGGISDHDLILTRRVRISSLNVD
jgi:hypothetical protein